MTLASNWIGGGLTAAKRRSASFLILLKASSFSFLGTFSRDPCFLIKSTT